MSWNSMAASVVVAVIWTATAYVMVRSTTVDNHYSPLFWATCATYVVVSSMSGDSKPS